MFNLLFIWVYFFQLHLKDFFLSQVARLFGRWFILGSLILTVCHNGVVFTILRVVKNNRRRWLPKRESYDGFSFTTLVVIVSRIIKKVYHKTMKAKTDTKK